MSGHAADLTGRETRRPALRSSVAVADGRDRGDLLFADRFLMIVDLGKKRLGLIRRN